MGITNLRFIVSSRVFKQLSKPCIKPRNIRDWDWDWSWIESDVAVITLIQCKALQWVFLGAVLDHCSDSEFAAASRSLFMTTFYIKAALLSVIYLF